MDNKENLCNYHLDEGSTGICSECGKNFCEIGRKNYSEKDFFDKYTRKMGVNKQEYCLPCLSDLGKNNNRRQLIMGAGLMIIGLILVLISESVGSAYVLPIIGFLSALPGFYLVASRVQKVSQFNDVKWTFLANSEDYNMTKNLL